MITVFHKSDRVGRPCPVFRDLRRGAWAALFAAAALMFGGLGGCGAAREDDTAGGAEFRTGLRTLVGYATSLSPARLTGVEVEEHRGFDRVSFGFEGPLPDYRVGYRAATAGDRAGVLTILLVHVQAVDQRLIDCDLPAVAEVRRRAADGESVRTTVTVNSRKRLPFRIGVSLDSVYLDVADPDDSGDPL